jgi:hypothetical protein
MRPPGTAGVRLDGVDEFAAHNLHPRDDRLGGLDEFLHQGDAVLRFLELVRGHVLGQFFVALELAHAEALPALVVFGDEGSREAFRRFQDAVPPDSRHCSRCVDSRRLEGRQLVHLAHLQLKDAPAVDSPAAMSLEPGQHRAGVVLRQAVVPRVRRGADPRPEDAFRRC